MVRICGWCKTYLGKADDNDDSLVSHGICPACLKKVIREEVDCRFEGKLGEMLLDDFPSTDEKLNQSGDCPPRKEAN